jgi:outer membrane receptor protein involved in Fe transport
MMLWALLLSLAVADPAITGIVRDSSGGAVPGAAVTLQTPAGTEQTVTGPDGRFTIAKAPDGQATLIVRAGGFAEKRQPITAANEIEIVLSPAAILEEVTVTPARTEQRLGDVPASIAVLDATRIRQSPAVVADDVLRQIPTFSLFRRSSSLASHPTTQGVSLRGIGPSGVSRTLVLIDNVPFNDPFGGWVYWTRVPLENVDRVEVVEGPSSSVYGNYGMGGVINIVSARAKKQAFELKPQFGNLDSRKLDVFGSDVWGKLGLSGDGSFFDTTGFPNVVEGERGPVDNNLTVNFKNVNVKSDYTVRPRFNVFGRVSYFKEDRTNGKVSTFAPVVEEANNTAWTALSGGIRAGLPDSSDLQARIFYDDETFRSNFLAIQAANGIPRSLGRLTLDQRVPTNNVGGMVQWVRAFGLKNVFTAGADFRQVDGDSEETAYDAQRGQTATLNRVSGGSQSSSGFYIQDLFTPSAKLNVTLAARVDHWRNYDAHNLETALVPGTPINNQPSLPERDDTVASPRLGVMYHLTNRVSAWGSLSAGFRAPTLNELYRQFRVGAVLTLANPNLGPERLRGGELGGNFAVSRDLTVRTVYFDNRMENPVSNVTIATAGTQITQQRQNLGRTRIYGIQTDAEYRLGEVWRIGGAYLFNQGKVTENPANPLLVDKYLPQVPQHRGSVQLAYVNPRVVSLSVAALFSGQQFDDDANSRGVLANGCAPGAAVCANPGLPGYGTLDFSASHTFNRSIEVFFGAQNLFDKEYYVGTNPTTIGSPRLMNVGVRLRFNGR